MIVLKTTIMFRIPVQLFRLAGYFSNRKTILVCHDKQKKTYHNSYDTNSFGKHTTLKVSRTIQCLENKSR